MKHDAGRNLYSAIFGLENWTIQGHPEGVPSAWKESLQCPHARQGGQVSGQAYTH